jgi:hypothetical protein
VGARLTRPCVEASGPVADENAAPRPVPTWVQALGIVDRPTGIEKARASRKWLLDAATNAFGRGQPWTTAVMLLSGLVTRGIGLHDAAIAALDADNPFAAFTLIRSYAENAAAVLYADDHPNAVDRMLGLGGHHPLSVGKLTAHANRSQRFGGFKDIYSELSEYAHPLSKSITASMAINGNEFRWSSTPAFRPGNDFLMACAWIVELAEANARLIVEFADSQGW